MGGPGQGVGLRIGVGEPDVGTPIPDPDIAFLVNVDRLEQRLITQPTVRIIGMGVNVTDVGQQVQRVVQVRPRVRVVPVVRGQPVLDGLSGPVARSCPRFNRSNGSLTCNSVRRS